MSFTVIDVPQRSPEWHAARLGRITGSRAVDLLATIKSGEAAARRNYRVELVLERLTGRCQERAFQNQVMADGIAREADAAMLYEALTGRLLRSTGFLRHDELMAGCSLDGDVGGFEGIVEAKCPIAATHLTYLNTGIIPHEYFKQIIHNLWVSGAAWCDWLSYHPEFPEPLRAKLVRVPRDEAVIHAYETAARVFLAEVDAELEALKALC